MNAILNTIEWIADKLKVIGAVCLVGMTLLTCADIIGRFFRHPIFGAEEIVGFLATLSVAMALPYTHKVNGHIGVELVVRLLSEKVQNIIDLSAAVISLVLFAIVTWRMTIYARTIQNSGEVSISLELPEYIIIYIVAFSLLVFTLIVFQDIFNIFRKLRGK